MPPGVASVVHAGCRDASSRRTRRENVFAYLFPRSGRIKCLGPKAEEGAGGRESHFPSPVSLLRCVGDRERTRMNWNEGNVKPVSVDALGQRYRRYLGAVGK